METRALAIARPGTVDIRVKELPSLGELDLLVNVRVGGVCRGDVEVFRGDESVPTPYIGGHESAGTVLAVGASVTRFQPGDNVAMLLDGRFAEFTVVSEKLAARLPDDIADWSDFVIEPFACAVNGVDVADIQLDDVVGVVGAGYMGQLVIRALGLTGARQVIAFDVRDEPLQAAVASGASATFRSDSDYDVLAAELEASIFRRPMPEAYVLPGLENGPFDVVYDTSGTIQGLRLSSRLVRVGGKVIMFGHQRGEIMIDGTEWHLKGIHIVNASPMSAPNFHQTFYRTTALLSAGKLSLSGLVSHSANVEEAQSLFDASGKPGYVKASILFDEKTLEDVK